jgi:hypothetical protein
MHNFLVKCDPSTTLVRTLLSSGKLYLGTNKQSLPHTKFHRWQRKVLRVSIFAAFPGFESRVMPRRMNNRPISHALPRPTTK